MEYRHFSKLQYRTHLPVINFLLLCRVSFVSSISLMIFASIIF